LSNFDTHSLSPLSPYINLPSFSPPSLYLPPPPLYRGEGRETGGGRRESEGGENEGGKSERGFI